MKNKILKFVKNTAFYNSFRQMSPHVLSNCLFDLLYIIFILLIIGLILFGLASANSNLAEIVPDVANVMNAVNGGEEFLDNIESQSFGLTIDTLKWFFVNVGFLVFLGIILLILNASLLKTIIWNRLMKKSLNIKDILNEFKFSVLWYLFWIILTVLLFVLINFKVLVFVYFLELILFVYLTSVFRTIHAPKTRFLELFKETFSFGLRKFYLFIVPVLLMLVTAVITSMLVIVVLSILTYIPNQLIFSIFYMALIFMYVDVFINWCRVYFILCVKKLKKR